MCFYNLYVSIIIKSFRFFIVKLCFWYVCVHVLSHFSYVWLWDRMDCSPSDSSVHGILQARILEWVAMPSSRGSSWPRDRTVLLMSLALAGGFFTTRALWEAMCLVHMVKISCICQVKYQLFPLSTGNFAPPVGHTMQFVNLPSLALKWRKSLKTLPALALFKPIILCLYTSSRWKVKSEKHMEEKKKRYKLSLCKKESATSHLGDV